MQIRQYYIHIMNNVNIQCTLILFASVNTGAYNVLLEIVSISKLNSAACINDIIMPRPLGGGIKR